MEVEKTEEIDTKQNSMLCILTIVSGGMINSAYFCKPQGHWCPKLTLLLMLIKLTLIHQRNATLTNIHLAKMWSRENILKGVFEIILHGMLLKKVTNNKIIIMLPVIELLTGVRYCALHFKKFLQY